jgi:hypothetical protein
MIAGMTGRSRDLPADNDFDIQISAGTESVLYDALCCIQLWGVWKDGVRCIIDKEVASEAGKQQAMNVAL